MSMHSSRLLGTARLGCAWHRRLCGVVQRSWAWVCSAGHGWDGLCMAWGIHAALHAIRLGCCGFLYHTVLAQGCAWFGSQARGCMWPGWAVCSCEGPAPTHVAVRSLAVCGQGSAPAQNNTLDTAPLAVLGHSPLGAVPRRWLCLVGAAWGPWEDRMASPELQLPNSPALQIPPLLLLV